MEHTNNEPLIYKNKALNDLFGIKDVLMGCGDPFLANIINRAIDCIKNQKPAQVEKIVYCYECVKRDTSKCPMFYSQRTFMLGNKGFCSCGDNE